MFELRVVFYELHPIQQRSGWLPHSITQAKHEGYFVNKKQKHMYMWVVVRVPILVSWRECPPLQPHPPPPSHSFTLPFINSALNIHRIHRHLRAWTESWRRRFRNLFAFLFQLHMFSPIITTTITTTATLTTTLFWSWTVTECVKDCHTLFPCTMEWMAFALAIIHWQNGFSLRANSVTAYTVTSRQFSLYSFPLLSPSHLVLLIASLAVDSSAVFCSRDHSDECSPLAMKRPLELKGKKKEVRLLGCARFNLDKCEIQGETKLYGLF